MLVFQPLGPAQMEGILALELNQLVGRLSEQGFSVELDEEAKQFLIAKGFDPKQGARTLRHTLEELLQDPIADLILRNPGGGRILACRGADSSLTLQLISHRQFQKREASPLPVSAQP
jgi:ATP-dependent Clp protease ATP-binding subunit ClpC